MWNIFTEWGGGGSLWIKTTSWYAEILHQPRYNWNIVESGIEHNNPGHSTHFQVGGDNSRSRRGDPTKLPVCKTKPGGKCN
jgi:hypothetical protein